MDIGGLLFVPTKINRPPLEAIFFNELRSVLGVRQLFSEDRMMWIPPLDV